MTRSLQFYFDAISPYVWLAFPHLRKLCAKRGVSLDCVPVLLAALLNAHESKGPAEIPAKRTYTFTDVMRWAKHEGRIFCGPPAHPFNPLRALRLCVAVEDAETRAELVGRVLEACWGKGQDITREDILLSLVGDLGLPGRELLARAQENDVKDRLKRNTESAISRGVFGVPSFYIEGELFWGSDRLALLDSFLQGTLSIDRGALDRMLVRPSAASRI